MVSEVLWCDGMGLRQRLKEVQGRRCGGEDGLGGVSVKTVN